MLHLAITIDTSGIHEVLMMGREELIEIALTSVIYYNSECSTFFSVKREVYTVF